MTPRAQRMFTAPPGQQRGAVTIIIVIALLAILMMAALVLDGGHMLLNKTRLQNAVDAAALSGAKTLSQVMGASNAASTARDAALSTLQKMRVLWATRSWQRQSAATLAGLRWWNWQTMSMGLSPSQGRPMPPMCGSR